MTGMLSILLADTYALYLKTQNYHWHVHGPQFKSLHELFETQYRDLAEAVDAIAERLLMKGSKAPATFSALNELKTLKDGDSSLDAPKMVKDLASDHQHLVNEFNKAMKEAQDQADEGTIVLLSDRIAYHEKAHWMLSASI